MQIANAERQIERCRQQLAEELDFEPYTAFRRVDRGGNGYLSSYELTDFLRDNGILCTDADGYALLRLYDSNADGRLSYSDFMNAVLPRTEASLRGRATARSSYYVGPRDRLPRDVEYHLSRVLEKELEGLRKIESARLSLSDRYDWNLLDAFRNVDDYRVGYVSPDSLHAFLRKNGELPTDDEIDAVYRYLDRDGDGRLSYLEFVDGVSSAAGNGRGDNSYSRYAADRSRHSETSRHFHDDTLFRPSRTSFGSPSRSGSRSILASPTRSRFYSPSRSTYGSSFRLSSPLRSRATSPGRRASPTRVTVSSPSRLRASPSRLRASPSRLRATSPSRVRESSPLRETASPSRLRATYSPSRSPSRFASTGNLGASTSSALMKSPLRANDEAKLASTFKEQINIERELESVKQELSLKSDFNLLDAFRFFDKQGNGKVNSYEFEETLKDFGVFPVRDEVYLFIRRYDRDGDGKLRYSEFCDAFMPVKAEYASILNGRIPSYKSDVSFRSDNVFLRDTESKFIRVLRLHLQAESSAESTRQYLQRTAMFTLREAFEACDRDANGYLTIDEFAKVLLENGIYHNHDDLVCLMSRYDKNKNGRVSYSEFFEENMPKSPKKY